MADEEGHSSSFRLATEALVIFALLLIVYGVMPTQNYYWDGLIYGEFLERVESFGPHLFHPNHLIYNFSGYTVFHSLRNAQIVDRALFALQYLSIFFGALSVALFYLVCRRLFGSVYLSLVVTAVLAFAASWWRYATDANVYVISICFLILSFYFLIDDRRRNILAALSFFAAMLFHELAILFFPAACIALCQQSADSKACVRSIGNFGIVSGGLIALSYLSAFFFSQGSFEIGAFVRWMTSYAGAATFGPDAESALFWLVKGTRQLFVDGSTNLIQRGLIADVAFGLFVLSAIALVISVFLNRSAIYRGLSTIGSMNNPNRGVIFLCIAWVLPYAAFFLLFEPQNTFYRLFYLPPLVLLAGVFLCSFDGKAGRHYGRALLVLVFALYNFVFYIYPNSQVMKGSVLELALDVEKVWNSNTLVLFDPLRPTEGVIRTVRYFNPAAEWKPVDSVRPENIRIEFRDAYSQGRAIWFEKAALEKLSKDPSAFEAFSAEFTMDPEDTRSAPKYNLEFTKLVPRSTLESIK